MKVIQCAGKCRPLPSRVAAQRYEGEDMKVGYVNQTFIGAAIMHICPKNFSSTVEDIDTRLGLKSITVTVRLRVNLQ